MYGSTINCLVWTRLQYSLVVEEDVKKLTNKQSNILYDIPPPPPPPLPGDAAYQQLKEEADSAHSQVEFLNSVIVELQKKNHDLELRLSAMEDSGIHTNGDFGGAGDHIDMEYAFYFVLLYTA